MARYQSKALRTQNAGNLLLFERPLENIPDCSNSHWVNIPTRHLTPACFPQRLLERALTLHRLEMDKGCKLELHRLLYILQLVWLAGNSQLNCLDWNSLKALIDVPFLSFKESWDCKARRKLEIVIPWLKPLGIEKSVSIKIIPSC